MPRYPIPSPVQSPALSRRNPQSGDEVNEVHETYIQSRPQRQQRRQISLIHSRPSSSSGSIHTLRRTPKFEEQNAPRRQAPFIPTTDRRSLNPPIVPSLQLPDLPFSDEGGGSTTPRSNRQPSPEASYWPQRSTRISNRTGSAILYALEVAIRTPILFTPDTVEEEALMSDLVSGGPVATSTGSGRAQNGGSRAAAGSVPVFQNPPPRAMTPREVMRLREDRQARKKAESETKQKEQEAEAEKVKRERVRPSGERRDPAAGVAGGGDTGGEGSGNRRSRVQSGARVSGGELPIPQGTGLERRRSDRESGTASRVNPNAGNQPSSYVPAGARTQEPLNVPRVMAESSNLPLPSSTRTRGASVSQAPPKPIQPQTSRAASATYSAPPQPSQTRLTSAAGATNQAQAGPSAAPSATQRPQPAQTVGGDQPRNATASSFPHAFERWETLSSHWEGLTSYWMRRLEGNSDEMNREPLNQQLARQVTDLSAAGANLFHAVVELQRLRASSERKFQRWFFETRQEQEKSREKIAELENALRTERQARADAASSATLVETEKASAEQVKSNAEQMVKEMRRELQISKEEARRAWEELGRRAQEERERTASLQKGEPTLVGDVQVVPLLQGGASRQTSINRPPARDGPLPGDTGALTGNPTRPRQEEFVESPREGDVGFTSYDPARSETDTDPFTEGGREISRTNVPPLPSTTSHPQQLSNLSSTTAQSSRALFSTSPQRANLPATPSTPVSGSGGTYLSYGPEGAVVPPAGPGSFYQQQDTALLTEEPAHPRSTEADERSYVQSSVNDTISEEEYEYNERGEIRTDAQGNRLIYRRGPASEDSDEYDVQDQLEQERINRQRYGQTALSGVEYGHGSTATIGGPSTRPTGAIFVAGPERGQPAVYGGQQQGGDGQGQVDYSGSGYGSGWEAVPRHHHPTRLSDVLEEDERSRASPSRASEGSRGIR